MKGDERKSLIKMGTKHDGWDKTRMWKLREVEAGLLGAVSCYDEAFGMKFHAQAGGAGGTSCHEDLTKAFVGNFPRESYGK